MNRPKEKISNRVEDVETLLLTFRKFAKAKVPMPGHLHDVLTKVIGDDPDITAYYHLRSLRYPSIRRMLRHNTAIQLYGRDDDDDDDDIVDNHPQKRKNVGIEVMYR